jgi:HAD superfamily hydrolase (TIGR01459 family)
VTLVPKTVSTPVSAPVAIDGIGEIADRYDGVIFDLWGVVHNGVEALPGAINAMARLRAAGKRIALLSNAPRRSSVVVDHLSTLHIMPEQYDAIMTSGEDVWRHIFVRSDPWYRALGRKCLHIGTERDRDMFVGLDLLRTDDVADAEFLLNTGPAAIGDDIEAYSGVLEAARARHLPMICANPDLVVMRGDKLEICAGAIAMRYEALGGSVRSHGKPDSSVYLRCLEMLDLADLSRVLMVGDSFRTDVCGANRTGIDSLFVAGGIHGAELCVADKPNMPRIVDAAAAEAASPDFVVAALTW